MLKPNALDDSEFTKNSESEKLGDSGLEFDISSSYKSSTNIEKIFSDKTKKYFDIQIEGNPKPIMIGDKPIENIFEKIQKAFEEYSLPITNIANSYFEEEVDIKYQIRNICREFSDNEINYNNSKVQYIYSLCKFAQILYELIRKIKELKKNKKFSVSRFIGEIDQETGRWK
ncbi:hypothetical protein F8M41_022890 [Gigaspora margarita]|uniref:Uncharacterized protein n=1 Tax=Gigaspora margarita TaxID=4874 RepID=A0A8H4EHP0_GIGMA|nr:hypothetical protein F8M41_022890 [Gigaspora margarita]